VTAPALHVVVPGALDQLTGGYVYDSRIVRGLRERGWTVDVHELPGRFPDVDDVAAGSLRNALNALPSGARVLVDGLAMGALPGPVRAVAGRLSVLSLVHHPLADETGIGPADVERYRGLETEALGACIGVIVTSPFTAARLETFRVPASRVRCVTPGVDRVRLARGPGSNAPAQILCVASLIPRKGQRMLVEALARLRALPWSCVCVGSEARDPTYAARIRTMIEELRLTPRIRLAGELDRPSLDELYDTSTFFVLPSYFEGYGMVLTEALARGLPVVSTTAGAIPRTVPSDAGILVSPGKPAALGEALSTMLDPVPRARLTRAARAHAAGLLTWDHTVTEFERAILELAPVSGVPPDAADV